jgi:hypothetical protein
LRFGRESEHIEPIVPIIINLHSASSEALKKRFQNNRTKNWSVFLGTNGLRLSCLPEYGGKTCRLFFGYLEYPLVVVVVLMLTHVI